MLPKLKRVQRKLSIIRDRSIGNLIAQLHHYIHADSSQSQPVISLVVTDAGPNITYGDYFTALELGSALEKSGYKVDYLKKHKGGWNYLDHNCIAVVSLLEDFNPTKIKIRGPRPFCIAWARNWFDRWATAPGIQDYDLVLASSATAVSFLSERLDSRVELFPIASNTDRFYSPPQSESFDRDLCFTGSYWFQNRELETLVIPSRLKQYQFDIFGSNWDQSDTFRQFWRGFLNYAQLPDIYRKSKIVLDDANAATKPFGAVNSRVYDAIASGALVPTNGQLGAQETFEGLLPSFSTGHELHYLIDHYLKHENERARKVLELQKVVLKQHTYNHRAKQLLGRIPSSSS